MVLYYTVKKGDCLWNIGKRYGVSSDDIWEWNRDQIKNPDLIFPGQVLKIYV